MHLESRKLGGRARLVAGALLSLFILGVAGTARGAEGLVPFDGEKSSWHGFDRYDFLMDETDPTIKPYKVAPDEKNAVKAQVKGQRRCVVVVPKAAASGNPWSWRGCYWDHEPQTEVELLKRGFHIAFAAPDADAQGKVWDTWYKFLTEKHGLAKKAAFIGMSKGGVNEFNWGVVNPDKVACIYADNTALYDGDFAKVPELAKHDVPLLHVCGSEDFLVQRHTRVVEDMYHQLGGLITVIVKEGHAHHPHSLQNAKPIADWIEQHMTPSTANRPAFVDATFTKLYYYSLEPSFIYLKEEDTYATARGPGFTECYDRYEGLTSGKFKMGGISIVVPKTVAPGKPWVFTGDPIERDATVEQALLAKGYHILIVSPMGSGMTRKQWDDAYKLLVDNGFSNKPVLKGTGAMAGEAYAWAVANPGKVSCIYARNPLMKSLMAGKEQPIDNLAALAKAGVPVLHDCGALDPWLDKQTRVVEKRYKELDGKITVIVRADDGHFPLAPKDPKSVVEFIARSQPAKAEEPKPLPAAALPANNQPKLVIPAGGLGQLVRVEYPPSTAADGLQVGVTYTLWIPEGVKTLRGIIVHQHGAGTTASKEGSTAAYDLHWQALAKKWDCALLGPSYHVLNEKTDLTPGGSELWFDPRRGSEKTFLKALGALAAKSGHTELETVPWALWGHSGGGIWADVLSTLHPDRVVAIWLRSGSAAMFRTRDEFPQPRIPAAVYAIPIMANPGVKEKDPKIPDEKGKEKGVWWGNLATFREYRAEGAPIGFAPDPRTGHECGDSRYLAIPFFDACLAMRLPDKGGKDQTLKPVDMSKAWLAPVLGDKAQPAAEFKGNAKEAVWLPNEAVAKAWMDYVKTGSVSDVTPPSAPFNVKPTYQADKGVEITWNAEADLESGIRGFIVLRDGQELAQVPPKPVGKFGRPLFQSMTYHDTPSKPLPEMRYVDASAKPDDKHTYTVITVNSVELKSEPSDTAAPQKEPPQQGRASNGDTKATESAKPAFDKNSPFFFDGTISRQTLENYLDHAITMGYFLVPGEPEGYKFPYRDDDVRMIHNVGAKFIGRAIYRWGQESKLGDPVFLGYAKKMVDRVHSDDPEVVFQGCLFEQVSTDVNKLTIPAWVFKDFDLPVEDRTFSHGAIIKRKGRPEKGGGRGGVPIINNLETRLWFYYLAVSYLNIGCEALHLGQVGLIGADDKDLKVYSEFLAKVRSYAKQHARRHLVLMDGHVPSGGMVKDGVSLLDFNSFPLRIQAVPGKPQEGVLEVGHLDAIFKRSKGCISPSGWKCDSLPYLVELDNFGRGSNPNVADPKSMFCWGWDEISWFAKQPEEYRNQWLPYAHQWIKQTDPNGHLEMPGTRMISCPNETLRTYFANTKSSACPVGYSQEETIKKTWNEGQSPPPASSEITEAMKPYLDHYKLAGVIAIVADKTGKVHYKNLLGFADVEAKKPVSDDNVFWIASMTKMFAGASIMMLVDEGKVSLDDPVTKFIPRLDKWMVVEEKDQSHVLLKPPVRPVTIRHLLSHTSGLAGTSELQQATGADGTPLKARALSSVTGPLQSQPGDKYAYGNQGMNVAARVVEIVSDMPYETFLQKRFFDPLGMTETTFWPSEAQVARLAGAYGPNKEKNGYARGDIGFLTKPLSDRVRRFPEAGGGLFSTTHDIFRYGLLLANDGELEGKRYLSHAAMDELRKEQTGKTKVNYSLGYHLRNGMFGHDGAYGTDLSVDPKTGMVAIFMVQCSGGDQWAARDLFLQTATKIFPK